MITEAQRGGVASSGGQSQGSNTEARAVGSRRSLHARRRPPSLLPAVLLSPSLLGGCALQGRAAAPSLTSLVLSAPLQKSCTWHRGPPACPAASARSIPWRSCAPISGQGPMPTPVASRSSPSFPQQRALLQPHQSGVVGQHTRVGTDRFGSLQEAPMGCCLHSESRSLTRVKIPDQEIPDPGCEPLG